GWFDERARFEAAGLAILLEDGLYRPTVLLAREYQLGVCAVECETQLGQPLTVVRLTGSAGIATAAPGNFFGTHRVGRLENNDLLANFFDNARELMPGHDRGADHAR